MNIKLLIEYDGRDFCGWQRQATGPSIQAALEDILLQATGKRVVVYGASRTDSGVHACGQVANFAVETRLEPEQWVSVFNYHLPRAIRILKAEAVAETFHAQKDAIAKHYEYVILNRSHSTALWPRAYFIPRPLNWGRIGEALSSFVGTHDYKAFQGAKADVKSTVRTVTDFTLSDRGQGFYAFRISGNGFLKQMVRTVIGTLVEIGLGKRDIGDVQRILKSLDRRQAGHTAPAAGLTLLRVVYAGE